MLYRFRKNPFFFIALVMPAALIVGFLILYPVANGVILSFTNASPLSRATPQFVGFDNYQFLFGDDVYFAYSLAGPGSGPCVGRLCVELRNARLLAIVNANPQGVAEAVVVAMAEAARRTS